MRFDHQAITRDFRKYGGGGDGHAQSITLNDHSLLDRDIGKPDGIEDEEIGWGRKLAQGLFHRTPSGLPDIHGINDLGVYDSHAKAKRHVPNQLIKFLTFLFTQPFRVTKPDERTTPAGKDDGSSNDRAGEWSATNLIQAGDTPESAGPCLALENLVRRQRHGRKIYAPAGTSSAVVATGAASCFVLPSARYSRSATRAILPFLVRR
jgi:hypothetical protein